MTEFICVECGMHIFRFIDTDEEPDKLCGTCLHMPGWFRDPYLRRVLGGDMTVDDLPENERYDESREHR
jgi:hypothetical protein